MKVSINKKEVTQIEDLNILTGRYTIGDVHMYKFSWQFNCLSEPVNNFHRMKTHLHINKNCKISATTNKVQNIRMCGIRCKNPNKTQNASSATSNKDGLNKLPDTWCAYITRVSGMLINEQGNKKQRHTLQSPAN